MTDRAPATLPTNLRFKLGHRLYPLVTCVCLFRAFDPAAMTVRYLVLTKDRRFAYLEAVIGDKGVRPATEMARDRAMRFLREHGEGDLVDEFPDIFREDERMTLAPEISGKAPKDRPAEPYLFPLH
jgi:hypothetical protein